MTGAEPLDLRDSTWPSWIDATAVVLIGVGSLAWALLGEMPGGYLLVWPIFLLLVVWLVWRGWRLAAGLRRVTAPPDRLHWAVWVSPTDYFGALSTNGPAVLTVADGRFSLEGSYCETCASADVVPAETLPRPFSRGIGLQLPSGSIRCSLVDPQDPAAMTAWVADRPAQRALLAALAPSTVDPRDGQAADRP